MYYNVEQPLKSRQENVMAENKFDCVLLVAVNTKQSKAKQSKVFSCHVGHAAWFLSIPARYCRIFGRAPTNHLRRGQCSSGALVAQ